MAVMAGAALQRMGANTTVTANRSLYAHQASGAELKTVFSYVSLTLALGTSLGPMAGAYIIELHGLDVAILASGAVPVGVALIYLAYRPPIDESPLPSGASGNAYPPPRWPQPAAWLVCTSALFANVLAGMMISYIPLKVHSVHPGDSRSIALAFGVFACTRVLVTVFAFKALLKLLSRTVDMYLMGLLLSTAGLALCSYVQTDRGVYLAMTAFGFGNTLVMSSSVPLLSETAHDSSRTNLHMGLYTFATSALGFPLGMLLGPLAFGEQWIHSFPLICGIAGILASLPLLLLHVSGHDSSLAHNRRHYSKLKD